MTYRFYGIDAFVRDIENLLQRPMSHFMREVAMNGFMSRTRQLGLIAAAFGALQLAGAASAEDREAAFTEAMKAYEAGSFSVAETHLQAAAKEGHRQAHEILGIMYTVGPPLYAGIETDRPRAVRHLESAAAIGSEVSGYLLCALGRQAGNGPPAAPGCNRAVAQPPSHLVLGDLPYESD